MSSYPHKQGQLQKGLIASKTIVQEHSTCLQLGRLSSTSVLCFLSTSGTSNKRTNKSFQTNFSSVRSNKTCIVKYVSVVAADKVNFMQLMIKFFETWAVPDRESLLKISISFGLDSFKCKNYDFVCDCAQIANLKKRKKKRIKSHSLIL